MCAANLDRRDQLPAPPFLNALNIIPLFPELASLLAERFAAAADGDSLVLPMLAGRSDSSLRDTLIRTIEDADLTVWPRLWHNLRSSRQIELEDRFKPKVVCAWLGNSELISRKHYIQVTEQDYAKAADSWSPALTEGSDKVRRPNELLRRVVEAAQQAAQTALVSGVCDGQHPDEDAKLSGKSHLVLPSHRLSKRKSSPGGI